MAPKESKSSKIRLPVLSVPWVVMTAVMLSGAWVILGVLPWNGPLVPIKLGVLAIALVVWSWVAVIRPPRIESREDRLVLRAGIFSKPQKVEWRYIDSILLWTLNFQGSRSMVGIRLKRGTPRDVYRPKGMPERFGGYPEGFPPPKEITNQVRYYSMALDWVKPKWIVELIRTAAPRVKVMDVRDPRNPVELWPEDNGMSLACF